MELLPQDVRDLTRKKLEADLVEPVTVHLFTQEPRRLITLSSVPGTECAFCRETRQLLEEVTSLSDKLHLVIYDFEADRDKAASFGVDKIPAIVVAGPRPAGVVFYGIPSGYEYSSLLEALVDASRGTTDLAPETKEALKTVSTDVRIQVFVTPTCPYCTVAVRLAHRMAVESPRLRSEMVEATEFPHLTQRYNVFGVPKTVINETVTFEGAVPESVFLARVLEAAGLGQTRA